MCKTPEYQCTLPSFQDSQQEIPAAYKTRSKMTKSSLCTRLPGLAQLHWRRKVPLKYMECGLWLLKINTLLTSQAVFLLFYFTVTVFYESFIPSICSVSLLIISIDRWISITPAGHSSIHELLSDNRKHHGPRDIIILQPQPLHTTQHE